MEEIKKYLITDEQDKDDKDIVVGLDFQRILENPDFLRILEKIKKMSKNRELDIINREFIVKGQLNWSFLEEYIREKESNVIELPFPEKIKKTKTADTYFDALKNLIERDDLRYSSMGVYFQHNGNIVATDGMVLGLIRNTRHKGENILLDSKTGADITPDGFNYPKYEIVIPDYKPNLRLENVELDTLKTRLKQCKDFKRITGQVSLHYFFPYANYEKESIYFSVSKLHSAIHSLLKLGVKNANMYFYGINKPLCITGKDKNDNNVEFLVMPTLMNDEELVSPVTPHWEKIKTHYKTSEKEKEKEKAKAKAKAAKAKLLMKDLQGQEHCISKSDNTMEIDDILDQIFNELRDKFGMDDSKEGHLTKVHNKKWVIVTRDSPFLTGRSKMLVNRYYDLMPDGLVEEALSKEKEQDKEIKELVEHIKE